MGRPFFNNSIIKLEAEFESRKADKKFLDILLQELSFRSTERARKLKLRVMSTLQSELSEMPSAPLEAVPVPTNEFSFLTLDDYQKYTIKPIMNTQLTNNPSEILSSWIALEVLSPQTFKKPQDLAGANGSIVHFDKPVLPWEGDGEKSKPHYRLYYQIVLGTIDFEKAITTLLDRYVDQQVERPAPKGEAILAVVMVDSKGRLVEDPAVYISSFGWGVPQALKGNLGKLSEWSKVENTLRVALDKIMRRKDDEGKEIPLDAQTINIAKSYLISNLELPLELITNSSFAVRKYEYYTSAEPPEPLLLNSFYIGDLIMASHLFKEGKATANFQQYIGLKKSANRKDLLHDGKAFELAIAPAAMPPVRWPGLGRHPLVALQQAAVNLIFNELKSDGIMAVNGPPGTGKTTLLRDIVAGIVTKRAEAMCAFDDPEKAFTNSGERISAGQAWLTLYKFDDSLKGYEILIASSNNKAVENVSAELPGLKAIADDIHDLRYFTSLSDTLLERESWGLIAAVLGNAANRSKFRQRFWWDKEVGLSTYLAEATGTPQFIDVIDEKTGEISGIRKPKIVEEEDAPSNRVTALERWVQAKNKFQTVLAKSRKQLLELQKIREAVVNLPTVEAEEKAAKLSLEDAVSNERSTSGIIKTLNNSYASHESVVKQLELERLHHLKKRPGFFARLFNTLKAREWKQIHAAHQAKVQTAKKEIAEIASSLGHYKGILANYAKTVHTCQHIFSTASNKLLKAKRDIEEARQRLGAHMIDANYFNLPHEKKHLVSPWCDKSTQQLRDEVFIEAIKLHKAFIDAAAKPIRHNLGVLMKVFTGWAMPTETKQALLPDLWSTLFLVVPGVSTTFASVERMLGKLPPESLGWLLIDEAGQALPQAAVGALIRTKRAVVVGDPLQIEPVVTLPYTLTQSICRQFGVDPNRFNAPEASVQTLADAVTPYYAEFEGKHGSRFVGVPLLVHRRCEDPMFSISNAIAYERLMVQAKTPGNSPIRDLLGTSRWIDIKGQAQEKWCPEEGQMTVDILKSLRTSKIAPDLYIVTPFVIVADNLRKIIRDSGVLNGWVENEHSWVYERIGTIHTVQGREAEAVIFVLGAPQLQQAGARSWAGARPNLLNVAVTRAKEVLYVIGNRQLWQDAGLFKELSDRLL